MIGILGGTFDPIHFGHLRMAEEARIGLNLNHVRFIPVARAAHRVIEGASGGRRIEMVRISIENNPDFVLDLCEFERDGLSYTVDTLRHLKSKFPDESLVFIMGLDSFNGFKSWDAWDEILTLAHIAVVYRPGEVFNSEVQGLITTCTPTLVQKMHQESAGIVTLIETTALDISATDIRKHLGAGHSARYLLHPRVIEYIKQEGLYAK